MAHQSGTNPYGRNPNQGNLGNPTSTQVLTTSSGPPQKKVKTEHTPHAALFLKDHTSCLRGQPQEQPSQVPTRNRVLPLKELYLDDRHHTDELLEIYWLNGDNLSIKSNKCSIFGPFDVRADVQSLTYHGSSDLPAIHDPIFQLRTMPKAGGHSADPKLVTIKLDCSSPVVQERYYSDLLIWLKARINKKIIIRASERETLWESVAWAEARRSEHSTKQGDGRRLDELRDDESRQARQNIIDQIPQRMDSVVSDQKLKKRSRRDISDLPESMIPRRSSRSTSGATRPQAIDYDYNEIILVYPNGVPGAVNITSGDLRRLQPGDFLNDTLIEFGLKLWLKELEETDPILASQTHVFNSFFYKKLNQQKNGTDLGGHESVRKWTSKLDIFQKKYIIVPINENLHWYFAIICDPEHVLVPATVSKISSTRQQTRQSISEPMIAEEPGETLTALSYVSNGISKHVLHPLSPTTSDHERALLRHSHSDKNLPMDIAGDHPVNLGSTSHDDDPVSETCSVDSASIYQHAPPKKDKGKSKAGVISDAPKTYIFTFDSLGLRRPRAVERLSAYLKMEAQDKKKVINASSAEGRSASVPVQPNHSDCGIYLLHLAQTFMSDPVHYHLMILAQKSKSIPTQERQVAWHDHRVTDKRKDLAARIVQLSGEWKEKRTAKEEDKRKEALNNRTFEVVESSDCDSSDCEIDNLEPIPSTSKAKSGRKKAGHAARLRG